MVDSLKDLTKKLNKCKKLAKTIIVNALVFMKPAEEKNFEFFEEFLLETKNISRFFSNDYTIKRIESACSDLVEESEKILTEMDGFSKLILSGGVVLDYQNEYPFMIQIWSGDAYGEGGIQGIDLLINDLKKTLVFTESEENFFNFVRKNYLIL